MGELLEAPGITACKVSVQGNWFGVIVMLFNWATGRVYKLVPVQPKALDPLTVYVVVAVGETVMVAPVKLPGCHV